MFWILETLEIATTAATTMLARDQLECSMDRCSRLAMLL